MRAVVAAGVDAPGERGQRLAGDVDDGAAGRPRSRWSARRRAGSRRRGRAPWLRLARQTRSEPRPEARRSTRARTAASRSRSSPSGCCGSTTRRGRSAVEAAADGAERRGGGSGATAAAGLGLGGEHAAVVGQLGAGRVVPLGVEVERPASRSRSTSAGGGRGAACSRVAGACETWPRVISSRSSAALRALSGSSSSTRRLRFRNSAQERIASNLWRIRLSRRSTWSRSVAAWRLARRGRQRCGAGASSASRRSAARPAARARARAARARAVAARARRREVAARTPRAARRRAAGRRAAEQVADDAPRPRPRPRGSAGAAARRARRGRGRGMRGRAGPGRRRARPRRRVGGAERGEVGAQRVGSAAPGGARWRRGGEPEVERARWRARSGKASRTGGRRSASPSKAARASVLGRAEAAARATGGAGSRRRRRGAISAAGAPPRPRKSTASRPATSSRRRRRRRARRRRVEAAREGVPELADGLLRLHRARAWSDHRGSAEDGGDEVEQAAPHVRRRRSAARSSRLRIARSTAMPSAIRRGGVDEQAGRDAFLEVLALQRAELAGEPHQRPRPGPAAGRSRRRRSRSRAPGRGSRTRSRGSAGAWWASGSSGCSGSRGCRRRRA